MRQSTAQGCGEELRQCAKSPKHCVWFNKQEELSIRANLLERPPPHSGTPWQVPAPAPMTDCIRNPGLPLHPGGSDPGLGAVRSLEGLRCRPIHLHLQQTARRVCFKSHGSSSGCLRLGPLLGLPASFVFFAWHGCCKIRMQEWAWGPVGKLSTQPRRQD